jgi:hypothetical protein
MMAAPSPPLLFDRVVILSTQQSMRVEQFVALPLDVRIAYVLARQVAFYAGTTQIDSKVALSSLRTAQLKGSLK